MNNDKADEILVRMNNDEADEILAEAFQVNEHHAELPPATPLKKMPKEMLQHLTKGVAGKEIFFGDKEFPKQVALSKQEELVEESSVSGDLDEVPPVLRPKVH